MNSITKGGVISLILAFTFQTAILHAEQSDPNLISPGDQPLPTRPVSPDGKNPVNPVPKIFPDSLHPEVSPLKPPTTVEPDLPVRIQPVIPPKRVVPVPAPIKPTPPPQDSNKPKEPDFSKELRDYYELQRNQKKASRKKIEAVRTSLRITRAKSEGVSVTEVYPLATSFESLAIKAIFAGLDPNMEINALLRSSADMDLADHRVFRMDCKGDSCTALMRGLDPATSYYLSFLLKAADNEDLFYELISRNIEAQTFTTPGLPTEDILAKVKEIVLQEGQEKQIPIDENSVVVAPDQSSESCTAVAVCPRGVFNATAQSQSGNERFVGTVALFDGKGERYVSRFRFQKKSPTAPLSAIL